MEAADQHIGNPPLVSVVIPVYNRKGILRTAVESCLRQTYQNLEIIIVDDGSTDGTVDLIHELASSDGRIRKVLNAKNQGANQCRNMGVELAKGDYINFLDSDDAFLDAKIEKQVSSFLATPGLDVVVCPCNRRDMGTGEVELMDRIRPESDAAVDFITKRIVWKTIAPLWRTSFLRKTKGFNPLLKNSQDYEYFSRLLLFRPKVHYLSEVLCIAFEFDTRTDQYKIRSMKNIPRTLKNNVASRYMVLEEARRIIKEKEVISELNNYTLKYSISSIKKAFGHSIAFGCRFAVLTASLRLGIITPEKYLNHNA